MPEVWLSGACPSRLRAGQATAIDGFLVIKQMRILGIVVGVQGLILFLTGWGREGQGWLIVLGLILIFISLDLLYKSWPNPPRHIKQGE